MTYRIHQETHNEAMLRLERETVDDTPANWYPEDFEIAEPEPTVKVQVSDHDYQHNMMFGNVNCEHVMRITHLSTSNVLWLECYNCRVFLSLNSDTVNAIKDTLEV